MARKPSSGELYYSVAFEKKSSAADGYGGTTSTWEQQFTTRAAYIFLRGSETVQAARLEGRRPQVIRVRKSSDVDLVTTEWRIQDTRDSKYYAIRAVEPGLDRQYVDFLCESGVAT